MAGIIPIPSTRVSDVFIRQRLLLQTQSDQLALFRAQNTVATGRRVAIPSDDAPAALRGMSIQRLLERKGQVQINLQTNQTYLQATDSSLASVSGLLANIRGTAIAVTGTTASDTQREAAALEVDRVIQQLIDVGNQRFRGRSLFAGTDTTSVAYEQSGAGVRYLGDERNIFSYSDIDILFETNLHGAEVFGGLSDEVVGIADLNPIVSTSTKLADLRGGLGISEGSVAISDGTNTSIIDLSGAETIGDVVALLEANPPTGRTVQVDVTPVGLTVELDSAGGGSLTIKEVAGGTTVSELGILTEIGTSTGPVGGSDLDPRLTLTTQLSDILGVRATTNVPSVGGDNDILIEANNRGAEFNDVTVTFVDGGPLTFGLETAVYDDSDPLNKTLTVTIANGKSTAIQAITAINAQTPFTASLDPRETDNDGTGTLQATALDPNATGTTAGGSGIEFDQNSGLQITSNGETHAVSFTSAETVEDLLNILNGSSAEVLAEISPDGRGVSIRSRSSGTDFAIGENGGTTATELGLRTLHAGTTLAQLNHGRGVHTVEGTDFTITRNDGVELEIDLEGAATVGDVLDLINSHPLNPDGGAKVLATFVANGNGIRLSDDSPDGTNTLTVTRANFSEAAWDLGLIPAGQDQSDPPTPAGVATALVSLPGANNDFNVTALNPGTTANGITVRFVDTGLGAGNETVQFLLTTNELIFDIDTPTTTAQTLVDLVNNDPLASLALTAALDPADGTPNDGSGLVTDINVTAVTAGGTPEFLDGADVNLLEAEGVFNALVRLREALTANDTREIERAVELLDESNLQVNFARAELGARQQALDTLGLRLVDEEIELRSALSDEIDAELTEAISEFAGRQAALEASLRTTAQVQLLTLLDFL